MSLVAEYESSSESDSGSRKGDGESQSGGKSDPTRQEESRKSTDMTSDKNGKSEGNNFYAKNPVKLPSAFAAMERRVSSETSVLANEYKKEEETKTKALEQHVKMVNNTKFVPANGKVNGKKVCWMYRRGRCRLGKKCKMYHDNELRTAEAMQKAQTDSKPVEVPAYTHNLQKRPFEEDFAKDDEEGSASQNKNHKKRFGLGDGIVPPKKVIQHLERINQGQKPGY